MDRANSVLHRGSDYRGMRNYILRENGDGEIIKATGPRYEDSEGAIYTRRHPATAARDDAKDAADYAAAAASLQSASPSDQASD